MNKADIMTFCSPWLEAWTGNQPEKLITFYSEEAFYRDPARPEGLNGQDKLLAYFKKLLAANPDWKWEALEVFPTEAGFVAKWKATIPAGDQVVIEHGMDIVEVEKGKITRNEVYFDVSKLLAAASPNSKR